MTRPIVEYEEKSGDVPRGPLIAAGTIITLAFALALGAKYLGLGRSSEPLSIAVEERSLRFAALNADSLEVYDAQSGRLVAKLEQNQNGFIFGTLRGAAHKRNVAHIDPATPFALTRWQDGRITFDDPSTGMHVAVNSFGPTQVASFEQLFARPDSR